MIDFGAFRAEDGTPIYLQIIQYLQQGVVSGAVADGAELPGGLCHQSLRSQACRHGFYVKGVTLSTQFIRQAWGTVTLF